MQKNTLLNENNHLLARLRGTITSRCFHGWTKKARERCILHMPANLSMTYWKPFPRTIKAEVLSKTASAEKGIITAKFDDKIFLILSETLAAQGRNPLLDILSFLSFFQNKPMKVNSGYHKRFRYQGHRLRRSHHSDKSLILSRGVLQCKYKRYGQAWHRIEET